MRRPILLFLLLGVLSVPGSPQTAASIETKFLALLSNIDRWSNYGGNSDYERLEAENELLKKELLKHGNRSATLFYSFPRLKKEMQVVTSKDGRLRIYSWDRQTGGTMHDFDAVFQYRGRSGRVHSWTAERGEEYGVGVFYHDIFQLDDGKGALYLPVATFIGSTSLAGQTISVVRINGERLDTGAKRIRTSSGLTNSISFGYDFFSVVDREERPVKLFTFDEGRRSFSFPVVIEDEKTPQGRVTKKLITYRFDGRYFVRIS